MDKNQTGSKLDDFLDTLGEFLSDKIVVPDWTTSNAFRWRKKFGVRGQFQQLTRVDKVGLHDLKGIEKQKKIIRDNTQTLVNGLIANNILLTGARGTGKSSVVKAIFNEFSSSHLKLIEVSKEDLVDIPDMVEVLDDDKYKFIIFCDDLSFEANDPGYKALKAVLDGSIVALPNNVVVYATSNRRHLMPEYFSDNAANNHREDEVHPTESIEESVSLSERFGLWISFYPFDQNLFIAIVNYWVDELGGEQINKKSLEKEALQWAIKRGSRSGRIARQFAINWVGQNHGSQSSNGTSRKSGQKKQ